MKKYLILALLGVAGVATSCNAQTSQSADSAVVATEAQSVAAPDFRLPDMDGKMVSLSDYRDKWVVIDFWGSWCGWCIKGMPKLKEVYKKYDGKLEIIGVDCGDAPQAWRQAVEELQLPWVQLYNGMQEDGPLVDYQVQGFPTKVIVDPEGNIADYIVGEDPAFYTRLAELIRN